jgi:thermostable 8-oxoguanine DNA glycosylase
MNVCCYNKKIGLEVNSEKTKYMFMSRHQTAGQSNYECESNENRKTEIKIRNIAPLSYKLADMFVTNAIKSIL